MDREPGRRRVPGWWVVLQVAEFVLCLGIAALLAPFTGSPAPLGLWILVIAFLAGVGACNVWLWRRFVRP
jgi:membrane protein implicated in regulation of membrane protease activity